MAVQLYKGAYGQNTVSFDTAAFDFEGGTVGTDYTAPTVTETAELPSGERAKVCYFDILPAGMDRLTGYDTDPASPQNLTTQPQASVYQSGTDWICDTLPDAEPVTIGQQPDDWALHYRDRYYTRISVTATGFGGTIYVYNAAGATYSDTTQYYKYDGAQVMYYTVGGGFFGVSRYFRTFTTNRTRLYDLCGVLRRFSDPGGSPSSDPFIWRSGGATGPEMVGFAATGQTVQGDALTSIPQAVGVVYGRMLLQLIDFDYDGTRYIGILYIQTSIDGIPQNAHVAAVSMPFWRGEAPRPNYGRSSGISYGVGTFSDPSTPVGVPPMQTALTSTDYGAGMHIRLLSTYDQQGSPSGLTILMRELWSTTGFWSIWRNLRYDPLSAIISLHMIPHPLAPIYSGSELTIALTKITVPNGIPGSRLIDIDKGTVQIPEYYGSRLDYAPHTQAEIYLPFCGEYPLDISDVMGGSVGVTYRIDIATGDCVAFVLGTDRRGLTTISKQYKGNCAYRIPVSGSDNGGAGLMAALSSMVGGTVGMAAGNVVGGAAQIIGGAAEAVTAPVHTTTPQVQGSASAMGVLTPYIKIYRVEQQRPEHYADLIGDTAAIGGSVEYVDTYAVKGFTVFDSIDLSGVVATDAEKDEIRRLLQGGVYL